MSNVSPIETKAPSRLSAEIDAIGDVAANAISLLRGITAPHAPLYYLAAGLSDSLLFPLLQRSPTATLTAKVTSGARNRGMHEVCTNTIAAAFLENAWYVSGRAYRSLDKIQGRPNPVWDSWSTTPVTTAFGKA